MGKNVVVRMPSPVKLGHKKHIEVFNSIACTMKNTKRHHQSNQEGQD